MDRALWITIGKLLLTCAMVTGVHLVLPETWGIFRAAVEMPLGILTAVIGTPFFIGLLAHMQRNWS